MKLLQMVLRQKYEDYDYNGYLESETGLVGMNATCSATTPESIEKEAGSGGMNATCSADTPTSI